MADVKISGLPASTVPLAGTEVLPIVQGGATKQVSITNVTAGRVIAASGITTDTYKAASSAGGALQANNATVCLQWGAGGGSGLIFDGGVSSTAANAALVFSPTGTGTVAISPAGALTINPTTASTINNVVIGGSTPLAATFTTATANSFIPNSATIPTNGVFLPAANTVGFATNSTESMRIDSSGRLLVGTTATTSGGNTISPGGINMTASANFGMGINMPSGDQFAVVFANGGTSVGSISTTTILTTYNTTSDYRLKDNPKPLTNSGAFIDSLSPKTWVWKLDGSTGSGFIAHEFQLISPTSVTGDKDAVNENGTPFYQSMEASSPEVMANIIAELQSLRARLKAADIA